MSAPQPPNGLKVLFIAPEIAPLAKTGGLGDVAGALPPALRRLGLAPSLMMPLYASVDTQAHGIEPMGLTLTVEVGGRWLSAPVWHGELGGCPLYLIAQEELFGRPQLYGDAGLAYPDNDWRFTFFCRAAIALARELDLRARVVHCHDWQAGLVPAYLRTLALDPGPLADATVVFTVHNLAYQGIFPRSSFGVTGLPPHLDTPDGIEYWGNISLLKAGLIFADALTTVSPSYAREILTPENGMGMEGVLAARSHLLVGILNGADNDVWSPQSDPYLPAPFSADDLSGKRACRQALLRAYGLEADEETAVIGFVGRVAHQKGVDLIAAAADRLLLDDVRLCMLGTGEAGYEAMMADLAKRYPDRVGVKLVFSEQLSHLTQAGSDMLLMPSRFEPCGLNQIYSMRYGTIPVVRLTGGLRDTVAPFDPLTGRGTGFGFGEPSGEALLHAVREALWTQARPELWSRLVLNAMAQDFSWERSARTYAELYQRLLTGLPPLG